jgi:hypothetical protein
VRRTPARDGPFAFVPVPDRGGDRRNSVPQDPKETVLSQLAAYLAFSGGLDEDALLRLIMEVGLGLVQGEEGSLCLIDWETRELVFQITVGAGDSESVLKGQRFPLTQTLSGEVAMTGQAQASSPRYHGVRMERGEPTAVLAAPLTAGDEPPLGVITAVKFAQDARFSPDDIALYTRFGQICAHLLRQRLREAHVRKLLSGAAPDTLDPALRSLEQGPLGEEHAQVAGIARKLAEFAGGAPEGLALAGELCDLLVRMARQAAWRGLAE